ncbi:NAD-dependent malic enzyme [Aerococcus urinaeequi]|uniref:NAD-dependent malic enzyme n=1 Tax=Aerococcus urinaeequi TaxID=51665 RepID=A0AA47G9R6_9LACT|nr:malic enzyme-like NAD(P)-binding protein [Aerococcus urinaeequi]WAT24947.1 NAD-dependent malic enzyme [Aerococcus urinaeequi]
MKRRVITHVFDRKSVLMRADVDAVPISLDTQNVEEIISHVKAIAPSFGGVNLEDIATPRCFEIEHRLKEELDIPVFYDDQHGTAIVVLAGLINALKVAEKTIEDVKIVINGGGSAGTAIAKEMIHAGAKNVIVCDIDGAISEDDPELQDRHKELASISNPDHLKGSLEEVIKDADVFIGVSAPNVFKKEWIQTMNEKAIIFAMANPTPEIMPDEAKEGGAFIVATGRSDFPNQINNVLAFPGIFRGALDARASDITEEMQIAAARGIASIIPDDELSVENIIPNAFNPNVSKIVAKSVNKAAE